MCDNCKALKRDSRFLNGRRYRIHRVNLYRVYRDQVITIRLCHVCAIELFKRGEMSFLSRNRPLLRSIDRFKQPEKDLGIEW